MEETVLSGRVSRSRARRICSAVMADGRPIPRALTNPLPEPSSGHRSEKVSRRAERRPGGRTGAPSPRPETAARRQAQTPPPQSQARQPDPHRVHRCARRADFAGAAACWLRSPSFVTEALRSLKRRISDAIYARLRTDARRAASSADEGPGGQSGNDPDSSAAGSHPERRLFGQATPGPDSILTARNPGHAARTSPEENPPPSLTTTAKRTRYAL